MLIHLRLLRACGLVLFRHQCAKATGWTEYSSHACNFCKSREEEKVRREAEEKARREAEEKARKEAEEKAKWEAKAAKALKEVDDLRHAKETMEEQLAQTLEETTAQIQQANARANEEVARMQKEVHDMKEQIILGSDVASLVTLAVEAVSASPHGPAIPEQDFMLQEEMELLEIVKQHAAKTTDAAVSSAIGMCADFASSENALRISGVELENLLMAESSETEQAEAARNQAMASHWQASSKMKAACSETVLDTVEQLLSTSRACLTRAQAALSAVSGVDSGGDVEDAVELANVCLSDFRAWMQGKADAHEEHICQIKGAMGELSQGLGVCCKALDTPVAGKKLPSTVDLMAALRTRMQQRKDFLVSISADFRPVAAAISGCVAQIIFELEAESLQLEQLLSCAQGAERALKWSETPDRDLLHHMKLLQDGISNAEDDCEDAALALKRAKRRTQDKSELQELEDSLSSARRELRRLQKEQDFAWKEAYELASRAFPELPSRVLQRISVPSAPSSSSASFLTLAEPKALELLAPLRKFEMYDDPRHLSSSERQESRHDVWKGTLDDGVDVCLKKFNLGDVSGGLSTEVRQKAKTFQRELLSVVRLGHDHVVSASLFFLESDGHSLFAYVQYPYYPSGSLKMWLQETQASDRSAGRIHVVLHDALRGLEHVHHHGITHCDVKAANVLVCQREGQDRGVLCDFDLSCSERDRKDNISRASRSVVAGARGTPGVLSMAPEVFINGQLPDAKADIFSFGGMLFEALYPTEANAWADNANSSRWDGNGLPVLAANVGDGAKGLLLLLLHRDPSKRPDAAGCVSHSFFRADVRALHLVQDLESEREALRAARADHARLAHEKSKALGDKLQKLSSAREKVDREGEDQRKRYQDRMGELEREMQEAQQKAVRNAAAEEKIKAEQRKTQVEKERQEREIQQKRDKITKDRERLERERRDSEGQLVAKKKKLDEHARDLARKEADLASKELKFKVPTWWCNPSGFHMPRSDSVKDAIEKFMRATACGCSPKTTAQAKVVTVHRIENDKLWRLYQTRKDILESELRSHSSSVAGQLASVTPKQPDLGSSKQFSGSVNELYLFHGTSPQIARTIAQYGFDERRASLGGLYGAGSYFACNSCKSLQYSKQDASTQCYTMLLCRVSMGWPFRTTGQHGQQRIPPDNSATPGRPFDSIFAGKGVAHAGQQQHNEYVVFNSAQAYPEYLVHFKL
mmetsp:Transcript_33613/g.78457  ORF Transcript_33613/g.78457 Transcript_33613/m.78457 type:complete len:1219 (-) Transcript_33613:1649-5305(-)